MITQLSRNVTKEAKEDAHWIVGFQIAYVLNHTVFIISLMVNKRRYDYSQFTIVACFVVIF